MYTLKTDKYSDRVDMDLRTSLYEYGIIRNPETGKCITCQNCYELDTDFGRLNRDSFQPMIVVRYISFEDVKEALVEVPNGYFFFISTERSAVLAELDNNSLTSYISSLEQYNGCFDLNI